MELKDDIKSCLSGTQVIITNLTIAEEQKIDGSPLQSTLPIPFGKFKRKKCSQCVNVNFDWCWNCEMPVCKQHAFAIMIIGISIFNTICFDCKNAFIRYGNIKPDYIN